jgi:flagellar biosynthesis protein FlhB
MPKENELGQDKSEKPTAQRKNKARQDGQVSKSMEVNSAAVLIASMTTLFLFGGWLMNRLIVLMTMVYSSFGAFIVDPSNAQAFFKSGGAWMLKSLQPFFVIIAVVGILINLVQFGFLWSTKALKPKLDKLNPIKGFKNLFNQQALVRLVFNVFKVFIVGFVGYQVIKASWPQFEPLMDATVGQIFLFLCSTVFKVGVYIVAVLTVIAILDFAFQKYKYIEGLKMSKPEVKDERRMQEGDPKVKEKIRQMQFQMVFNAMIKNLPNADVIVTNPVHVAVALQYNSDDMVSPLMVGKGLRKLAEKIKVIARENNIPIVENPPLARALYKSCEIGEEIPGQFYQDVAEILAQIYKLQGDEEGE